MRIKILNEGKCLAHIHHYHTIFPNLRDVICVKDIKKRFDIIRKKIDRISTQKVNEIKFKVDLTDDGRTSYKERTGLFKSKLFL